jgi:hypothetical protein
MDTADMGVLCCWARKGPKEVVVSGMRPWRIRTGSREGVDISKGQGRDRCAAALVSANGFCGHGRRRAVLWQKRLDQSTRDENSTVRTGQDRMAYAEASS